MQRGPHILLGVGLTLVSLAIIVGMLLFPFAVQKKIRGQIRLEEGGELFGRWKEVPIPILMKVYIFNITNPDEFAVGAKPILSELGPYVYKQKREKVVHSIHLENDTIKFRPKITYFFRPDLSKGTEDDTVNFINVPLISVATSALKVSAAQRYMILEEVNNHDETLFTQRTVGEFLFKGYYEPMMDELGKLKGEELIPDNRFGIYYGKNGTEQDLMEIYSGVIQNERFGDTISWNGSPDIPWWQTDSCNMINGSDGSIFPPSVTRDRIIRIFSPDMCRSIYMTYIEDVNLLGVPAYRFGPPKEVFQDPRVYEENLCYCVNPGNNMEGCTKAGVFRLAPCRKGAPVVASWPHFYDGDEEYINQSVGLSPDKEKHSTFISLEPNTGSLVQASKRFQVNLEINPNKYFKPLKKLPTVLLPVLWVDESVMLNEENAAMISGKLLTPIKVSSIATYGALGFGAVLIVIAIVLMVILPKNKKADKN